MPAANKDWGRDQRQPLLHCRRGDRRPLRRRGNRARDRHALVLPNALVRQEKESLVLLDRASEGCAEVIALKCRLRLKRPCGTEYRIEEVPGVEIVVAEIIERLAVKFV